MEHYADLLRLCQLMHEKNEIQGRRHYARKRALRLMDAISRKKNKSANTHGGKVSKRLLKTSSSDLQILWYEAHIADNQAKLDLRRFTKANRKEMHTILKRNEWIVTMDNTNGRYTGVRKYEASYSVGWIIGDGYYAPGGRAKIAELAAQANATMDLETALIEA